MVNILVWFSTIISIRYLCNSFVNFTCKLEHCNHFFKQKNYIPAQWKNILTISVVAHLHQNIYYVFSFTVQYLFNNSNVVAPLLTAVESRVMRLQISSEQSAGIVKDRYSTKLMGQAKIIGHLEYAVHRPIKYNLSSKSQNFSPDQAGLL